MFQAQNEKSVGALPVAVLTFRGLRIAHRSKNEQRRSPRRYEYTNRLRVETRGYSKDNTYPEDIYHCRVLDYDKGKLRSSGMSRAGRQVNAFHFLSAPPRPPRFGLLIGNNCKFT